MNGEHLTMAGNEAGTSESTTDAGAWNRREDRQAVAFDVIGDRYDDAFPHKEGQIEAVDGLLERLRPGARVLDLGCGTGLPTMRQLLDGGCEVTGTEISGGMLDLARRNTPEARLIQADMVELDPDEADYDAVVAFFSLLMVPREHIPHTLELIRRSIVPGGWFCLSMVEADVDDAPIPFLGREIRVTGYLRDELRDVLHAAGFDIEQERVITYAPASTQAYPEVQLFLTCRRGDRGL